MFMIFEWPKLNEVVIHADAGVVPGFKVELETGHKILLSDEDYFKIKDWDADDIALFIGQLWYQTVYPEKKRLPVGAKIGFPFKRTISKTCIKGHTHSIDYIFDGIFGAIESLNAAVKDCNDH